MSESRDWNDCTIGEISKLSGGSAFKEEFQGNTTGEIPFIKVSDFNLSENEKYITRANNWVTAETIKEMGARVFPAGSVVFPKVGAALLSNRRRILSRPTALDNNLMAAIPNGCRSDYLHLALCQIDFSRFVQDGAVPSVNQEQVACVELSLPPLPEQKKIAEILSGIDQTITKLDSQKTKYDRLFASMLSEVFADLHKSHEIRRIGEICEVKRGASPRPIQSKKWWGDGRGWTRISDVTKSKKYLYKTKDRLSPEGEQRSVPINPGSIILSICATIGLPVIPKIPVCIHDGFVWFEGIEKEILPEFAYYFFLSVRDGLVSGRQTGTQGNLNTSIVSQQLIPIPPQSEQTRIIKLMSDMEFQAEKIDRKIQSHKNLKSSLSSDLLSGRKRVSI